MYSMMELDLYLVDISSFAEADWMAWLAVYGRPIDIDRRSTDCTVYWRAQSAAIL